MRLFFFLLIMFQGVSFKTQQRQYSRVKAAFEEKESTIQQYFKNRNLDPAGFHLFLRAFKRERELEVWIKEKHKETYTLLHRYVYCANSGTLGPKRREGDLQIPEGVYYINHFNPQSNFHLSLGLNYPNDSDKILSDKKHPGGSIYIHGNCVTIGCIPITDDKIKELYILAVEARNNGQQKIPVHIFPTRLSDEGLSVLKNTVENSINLSFWTNLKVIYQDFERTKKLASVSVNGTGEYRLDTVRTTP